MSRLYESLIKPFAFTLPAETAHDAGMAALRYGLATPAARAAAERRFRSDKAEELERFGVTFNGPVGIAAGFDKNGVAVDQLAALGFSFVEVGTVTFRPQPGNPKPRLFRLPEDRALINRLGFNNDGAEAVAERLRRIDRKCVVGVNIGRNKDVPNEEAVENYLACFDVIYDVADYITVNISSPNTPGLRELQKGGHLVELLGALQKRNLELGTETLKPLLVKIAPDLDDADIESVVEACVAHKVAGLIATNTTTSREDLTTPNVKAIGDGGLSGAPLKQLSDSVIAAAHAYAAGRLPIIGVGGIMNARDAFDKIAAGASLVQVYTGFVYAGPSFARELTDGIAELLNEHGFSGVDEAVGSGIRASRSRAG